MMDCRGRIVTQPTSEPVTLTEVKDHLRIDHNDQDVLLIGLLKTARQYLEEVCGRAFMTQTRSAAFKDWPVGDVFHLPFPPVQSVSSIVYTDTDGTDHTFSSSCYSSDIYSEPARVVLGYGETWPSTAIHNPDYPIEIQYVCGYTSANSVPGPIKDAIKVYVEMLYDKTSGVYSDYLKSAALSLITQYRVFF